jgi:CheY-like chemotaxis protein
VVVCKNQTDQMALRKRLMAELPTAASVRLEIVAQPLGPQKLGNVFKRIFSSEHFRKSMALPRTLSGAINHTTEAAAATAALPSSPLSQIDLAPKHPPLESAASLPPPTLEHSTTTPPSPENRRATTSPSKLKSSTQAPRPIPIRLKSGFGPEQGPLTSHHVLLVDDNSINLQLLVMFMKKVSLPYASAADGLQALDKYKACAATACQQKTKPIAQHSPTSLRHPQLSSPPPAAPAAGSPWEAQFTFVLMDISMPVMDGLESTRRIRAFERDNGLKKAVIIALTGLASAEAQRDALDAGVDFYLPKPVRFADLKRLLDI